MFFIIIFLFLCLFTDVCSTLIQSHYHLGCVIRSWNFFCEAAVVTVRHTILTTIRTHKKHPTPLLCYVCFAIYGHSITGKGTKIGIVLKKDTFSRSRFSGQGMSESREDSRTCPADLAIVIPLPIRLGVRTGRILPMLCFSN